MREYAVIEIYGPLQIRALAAVGKKSVKNIFARFRLLFKGIVILFAKSVRRLPQL